MDLDTDGPRRGPHRREKGIGRAITKTRLAGAAAVIASLLSARSPRRAAIPE